MRIKWGEIRTGLEKGINVSRYADPKLNETQMRKIREALVEEKKKFKKESPTPEQLKWCRDYAINRINNLSDSDLWEETYDAYYREHSGRYVSAEQISWCRENASIIYKDLDDIELWSKMKDVYEKSHQE